MSTFDALVADLTKDFHRVQPKDALQFCSSWFQSRLEEQRTRIRDILAHRPSLAAALPPDHFIDNPHTVPLMSGVNPINSALRARFARDGAANFSIDGTPDPHTTSSNMNIGLGRTNTPPMPPVPPGGFNNPNPHSIFNNASPFNTIAYDMHATPSVSPVPVPIIDQNYHLNAAFGTPTILDRRMSVSAEPISLSDDDESSAPLPVHPKSPDQLSRIKASISGENFLFSGLDEEQLTGVLNAMQEKKVKKNEIVILQGENGTEFYVVESGLCTVYKDEKKKVKDPWLQPSDRSTHFTSDDEFYSEEEGRGKGHKVFGEWMIDCGAGSSFGELALMYGHARAASVVAREDSTLWVLDRETFRTIILKAAFRRRTMYEHFVSMVPLLSALSPEERSKVADALVSTVYEDGQAVVKEGELGDKFYFVEDGEAIVTKIQKDGEDGEQREIQVGHYREKGDYFGELALLKLAPRAATVKAVTREPGSQLPKLKVAALDAVTFNRLLGPLRDIMERRKYVDYSMDD
ncbi:camp-dependent protein kinase regulatory subunit [Stereum hirsutum FP-91666 SS1]|uniref:camp-dependent protein kinase regulatory subunit n=1 Tax=Stereum hirsutum (strain FP-91666) TaxID=721885 RepID=UPI00044494F4|nr:camp-dependent protein kinase regulatory subunit [Stereum hirsutum FP-91666 SS1]EIM84768.1 camp-dependent protein kinase regulatory subunit [Stereum hirsutum FP-91666 SS1]